jgi:hypothetical protein
VSRIVQSVEKNYGRVAGIVEAKSSRTRKKTKQIERG